MRRARTERGNYKKYVITSIVIALLIAAILLGLFIWEKNSKGTLAVDENNKVLTYEGKEYAINGNIETFLIMGLDKFDGEIDQSSYNNDQQSDFLMLVVFDKEAKNYSVLHINRDTMATMDVLGIGGKKVGTVQKQIALAHTYGDGGATSNNNAAKAVSTLLGGIKVNHYAAFTLDSVAVINDLVGGVEVEVLHDFSGVDDTLVKGETVLLEGDMALTYVRTRKDLDDSTNNTRMIRQQQYLDALREKMEKRMEEDPEFAARAALAMADYMTSDCSATRLRDMARRMEEYDFVQVRQLEGETKLGKKHIEFYPDERALKETVIALFYVEK
jgi:LCP family protein required for cell wall assembly